MQSGRKKLIEWCRQNYNTELGKRERKAEMATLKKYGNAAYYPCELLEQHIVLYGAGKFGQHLHQRIVDLGQCHIVAWVDKMTLADYPDGVVKPECIRDLQYDQIVIAIWDETVAAEVREELRQQGVSEEKMLWVKYYEPWEK